MNGKQFYEVICNLVGEVDASLYANKFGDLDDWLNDCLYNYEGLGFYVYTTEMGWYEVINRDLWSSEPNEYILIFRDVINNALGKMEPYKAKNGVVYRGFHTNDLDKFLDTYRLGREVILRGFTSATFNQKFAYTGNVLFIIKTLTGCGVWFLSPKYEECEVLIPAGKTFRVEGVERQHNKAVVYLDELP